MFGIWGKGRPCGLALALAMGAALPAAHAALLQGQVTRLADGDTVQVKDEAGEIFRVRLSGIDAPERKQAYSRIATTHLRELVEHKQVTVEWTKLDRYGRLIGKLTAAGQDVGLEQVKAGLAWHYKAYAREQEADDRERYARAEVEAREQKRGLWQDSQPVPPWEFRRTKNLSKKAEQ